MGPGPLAATTATAAAPISVGRRWTVVGLLCLAFIIAYIDRVNLSVALADKGFLTYFGLSDKDIGLLSSAIFWSYAALQVPAGYFVDRFGAKWSLAFGFVAWSLVSAAAGMAESVTFLFAMRLLLGVGEAVVNPGGMRWIRYNVSEQRRGLAIGLYMASAKVGPAVGPPLAAWLLVAYGWRPMFVILGLGCLIWVIPWVALVRNDDRQLETAQRQSAREGVIPFSAVLRSPAMWGILIGTFAYQYFNYFCLTWMPKYFVDTFGVSLQKSSAFTAASYGGFAVVAIGAGWLSDRLIVGGRNAIRVRKTFIIAGFVLASTVFVGALAPSKNVALVFTIFSLSGLGLTTANYWALTQTLMPGGPVGRIVGLQNMAANIPGIVAPLLTGWLKQATGGYTAPMLAVGGLLLLGIASYAVLVRPKYAPRA